MTISHKGKRQLKVYDKVYLWYVKENEDWYGLILTVFLDDRLFLKREMTIWENSSAISRTIFPVTPAIVRREILREMENNKKERFCPACPTPLPLGAGNGQQNFQRKQPMALALMGRRFFSQPPIESDIVF